MRPKVISEAGIEALLRCLLEMAKRSISEMLTNAGYDSKTVNDQKLQGSKDSVLIEICKSEQRVLITLDIDFTDIRLYPPEECSGIIVLRGKIHSKNHLIDIFRKAIPLLQSEPLDRHLWIVEETKIRIRGKD
ncbi:MAG: DUF5615 family PIN-like protein [Deltaproteobacteria bacterium]|jgi:predicted nuclease of predicted toxin-antitoxin system|nr:DUF5615 family PIN-like protein [Deltaproteobacteria bacterium]MCL5880622.1 DUF5615 family PIN-like protein [Deltaproteobacteria bacterium]MDA8305133.1 DUF5615 family PIN-like protein [Deltaproteobacteria bacterium]